MSEPGMVDKALAWQANAQEEEQHARDEDREIALSAGVDDEWHARADAAEAAREFEREHERAWAALDELHALIGVHEASGEPVELNHLRDILTTAMHREYVDVDRGWCGTGL